MKHMYSSIFTVALFTLFAFNAYAQGPNDSGTYYQAADGKKGAELKTALCAIIYPRNEGGDLNIAYSAAWTHFRTTDARSDGKVWDLYSSITNYVFGDDQDPGSYDKGGDKKKKEGKFYNREHSWPNSWFGGKVMPMYTDLHHVYPTDKSVNEDRGNLPFGETDGGSKNSAENFSKIGTCKYPGYTGTVFEPNDIYKGDLARTYFYMVTCYEEKLPDWFTNYGTKEGVSQTIDGSKYPGLRDWQLEMLMKWSKNDPVSADKETPRNNAVYTIQNNRNPFIDYPGLEEYIWGSLKDVAFSYDHYQSPTAIITIQAERSTKDGVMYNLAGQVVDKSYKGIVIMNGKKFMNK